MSCQKMRVGAPIGGRVHWFLMFLSRDFKRAYRLRFDYEYHNYHFARYDGRSVVDEFIVIRSSRSCFRVMYFHYGMTYFEYFSEKTPKSAAEHVLEVFDRVKKMEARNT